MVNQGGGAETPREKAVKTRAYLLVAAGLLIVLLAYIRVLCTDVSASLVLPIVVALLGFAVATLGFVSFAVQERRSRRADRWRWSQLIGESCGPAPGEGGNGHRSAATGPTLSHWDLESRQRLDFTQRN